MQTETIKTEIKKSYGDIAKGDNLGGCCSNKACCTNDGFTSMKVDYASIEGYHKEADLSLGCGIAGSGIYSITIYADKTDQGKCCDVNENGCCGSEPAGTTKESGCCGTVSNSIGVACC
jgi:hypothetical protein